MSVQTRFMTGLETRPTIRDPALIEKSLEQRVTNTLSLSTETAQGRSAAPSESSIRPPLESRESTDVGTETPDGDRMVVSVLIALILVLLTIQWFRLSGWNMAEVRILHADSYEYSLNVNAATWVEWSQLDGISPQLAREIVAEREESGPYVSIEDLRRVAGVDNELLTSIRPQLRLAD